MFIIIKTRVFSVNPDYGIETPSIVKTKTKKNNIIDSQVFNAVYTSFYFNKHSEK